MPSSVVFESNGKHWVFVGEDEEGKVLSPYMPHREIGRIRDIVNKYDVIMEVIELYNFDLMLYDYISSSWKDIKPEESFRTLIEAAPGASQLKNPILFELYID